jgi:predicted transcriptional regulator
MATATTTIRLSDELKKRVARAAAQAGATSHNFIIEAIAEKTEEAERHAEFHRVADERYADLLATGEAISWADMRDYLERRIAGEPAAPPKPRKIAL